MAASETRDGLPPGFWQQSLDIARRFPKVLVTLGSPDLEEHFHVGDARPAVVDGPDGKSLELVLKPRTEDAVEGAPAELAQGNTYAPAPLPGQRHQVPSRSSLANMYSPAQTPAQRPQSSATFACAGTHECHDRAQVLDRLDVLTGELESISVRLAAQMNQPAPFMQAYAPPLAQPWAQAQPLMQPFAQSQSQPLAQSLAQSLAQPLAPPLAQSLAQPFAPPLPQTFAQPWSQWPLHPLSLNDASASLFAAAFATMPRCGNDASACLPWADVPYLSGKDMPAAMQAGGASPAPPPTRQSSTREHAKVEASHRKSSRTQRQSGRAAAWRESRMMKIACTKLQQIKSEPRSPKGCKQPRVWGKRKSGREGCNHDSRTPYAIKERIELQLKHLFGTESLDAFAKSFEK